MQSEPVNQSLKIGMLFEHCNIRQEEDHTPEETGVEISVYVSPIPSYGSNGTVGVSQHLVLYIAFPQPSVYIVIDHE